MRRNKIPAPLPFIFNLTSDFCGDRRRTIAPLFPPKQNLPSLTAPSHQWLTVSNYYVNRGAAPRLHSFCPIEHRRAIITGVHSRIFVSLQVDVYILPNGATAAIWTDRDGAEEVRRGTRQTWHLSSFVLHFAARLFHWKGSGEMSKVIIITKTITIIITPATSQFQPFFFSRSANEHVCFLWKR